MSSLVKLLFRDAKPFQETISKEGQFKPEANRYILYISYACPFCTQVLTTMNSLFGGKRPVIDVQAVNPIYDEKKGWRFVKKGEEKESYPAVVNQFNPEMETIRELYNQSMPKYEGIHSVPLLYDRKTKQIVNNDASQLIRILNDEHLRQFRTRNKGVDFYPKEMRSDIDIINQWIQENIILAVYEAGWAENQKSYKIAYHRLFKALDIVEEILSKQRYILGSKICEADIKLFQTFVRFDSVYSILFKCNKKQLREYPSIWGYTRDLYQTPGFGESTYLDHIKRHYFLSQPAPNPKKIIPIGPKLDFLKPAPNRSLLSNNPCITLDIIKQQ